MGLGAAVLSLVALALDIFVEEKTNKFIPGAAIKCKGSVLPALFMNVSVSARILVLPAWEPF
jgi:hypothetical protein